ncbi:aminomethyl-transferring glycine dehydrogenase subunit GcvPA [Desulfovibrio piger]|uniref:aminomethyl-transferring glycine dehydrogenase subunit GcvPA n=1 Tax=Desulfovibrio piger TaxID=901 RepID=UPI003F127008
MGRYVPITPSEEAEMLSAIGVDSLEALYESVPHQMLLKDGDLDLPAGKSELEVRSVMTDLAEQNTRFRTVLRGAGAYRHFIPAAVGSVVRREELVTAYTPYQPEISQGILQSIFEYQTMICQLTGMDVSNASVYDGATAAAEATAMCKDRKRVKVYVSACVHPQVLEVVKTYSFGSNTEVVVVPAKDGRTDAEALTGLLGADAACFLLQQPNYFGQVEDAEALGAIAHAAGAKFIMSVNPIAAALLPTPAECGADVAVGEGQPLGMPLSFGGPYLGFMAATNAMLRKLPGRIVGQTEDREGRRGYVLTLSAREQHIRREKASSNICSNEALCALTAAVYMAAMGPDGMEQAASLCTSKAHYLASQLEREAKLPLLYEGEFFHEFVTACPPETAQAILDALEAKGILGGQPVEGGLLWCATELVTKAEMDQAVSIVKEVCGQ